MTNYQENYYSMFKVVKVGINPYLADIDAIPAFKTARIKLFEIIDQLSLSVQKQSINVSGQTEIKSVRRIKMCDAAFEMGQIISAYALANDKIDLNTEVNYPLSAFTRQRDEVVAEVCKTIHLRATENIGELMNFGIQQLQVDDLNALITDYSDNSQLNKVSWQKKYAQSDIIGKLIIEGKDILGNSFDKMILLFRINNPELFAAYNSARNSMPTRHAKKSNGEVTDEEAGILTGTVTDKTDGIPIQGATVNITATTFSTETDEDGIYLFDTLPAGTYNVEVIILDYQTATLAAQKVIAGDETVADFAMLK